VFIQKLNNEVKSTFEVLGIHSLQINPIIDDILVSFEKKKGRESMVMKQFQNVMTPLILRILDKFGEYAEKVRHLKNRDEKTVNLERELLLDPIFGDFKVIHKNYTEQVFSPSQNFSSDSVLATKELE